MKQNNHTNLCGKESIQFEKRFSRKCITPNTFITNFLNTKHPLLLFSNFQSPGGMWRCARGHPLFPQGFHTQSLPRSDFKQEVNRKGET